MVSARLPTSMYSSTFNNPLVTVTKAPITIGIIHTFMFLGFLQFSSKVEVLILFFTFFQFYVVCRDRKVNNFADFLFWLIIIRSGLQAEIIIIIIQKEYLKRTRKLLETKLLVRYSGPFLKLTRDEIKQMDQRIRKLITMYKALHPRDDVDRLYASRKEGGRHNADGHKSGGKYILLSLTVKPWVTLFEPLQ